MRLRLLLCVGLLAAWTTSDAWAGGTKVAKIRELLPVEGENAGADGVATIIFKPYDFEPNDGEAHYTVVITGFQPETTYRVALKDGPGLLVGGVIETNPAGNGHWELKAEAVPDPVSRPEDKRLEVWQDLNNNFLWDAGEPGAYGLYD